MYWKTLLHTFATKGAKLSFQLSLFLAFLYFFGLPAIEKYRRKDIMVVEQTKFTNGIPAPAITITVVDQIHFVFESCTDLNFSVMDNCIDANSKNWSQVLKGVVLGFGRKKSLNLTKDLVRENFSQLFGKYFTLNMTFKIGPDDLKDQMYVLLDPQLVYRIHIHDPDFFIYTSNLAAIPMILKSFDTRTVKSHFYQLDLTEMNELDQHNDPCNSSPDYNFQKCIKESVSSKVSDILQPNLHIKGREKSSPENFKKSNIFLKE